MIKNYAIFLLIYLFSAPGCSLGIVKKRLAAPHDIGSGILFQFELWLEPRKAGKSLRNHRHIQIGGWGAQPGNLNGSCVRDPVAGALEFE